MNKRTWLIGGAAVVGLLALAVLTRGLWRPDGAVAQSRTQAPARVVAVEVAKAMRQPTPVRVEALGTVVPIAAVSIKARLETEIVAVHFADGAYVKQGDVLFTLDSRQLEAMISQAEGVVARDKAQLEGAERDVRRFTALAEQNATPITNLDNAKTQANMLRAAIKASESALENLRVQLTYCTIRAPISGRISATSVKVGNFVRPSDTAPLATINQIAPIYVSFGVPQRVLPEVREALNAGTAQVEAIIPGEAKHAHGKLTVVDNTIDPATGMVGLRATMDNQDQILWPGALVTARLTLRIEDAVVVPSVAVQSSQTGTYVFVVKDQAATVRPVTVTRTFENLSVIGNGLDGSETVVVDGQLLLNDGTKVAPRPAKAAGT